MTYHKNGFTFSHVRGSQWRVTFGDLPFGYVSTAAVIRALRSN